MFSNPWEGPESPATFALLVLVIPARLTRIRVVFLVCGHPFRQETAELPSQPIDTQKT